MSSASMLRQIGTAHRYPDSVSRNNRVLAGRSFRSRGRDAGLVVLVAMAGSRFLFSRCAIDREDRPDRRLWKSTKQVAPLEDNRSIFFDLLSQQVGIAQRLQVVVQRLRAI